MTIKTIKSISAILFLTELYTSTIKHDFLLLFLFPAIVYFSLEALFRKKYVFSLVYAVIAIVYNSLYPLTLPLESWTLINSATSILLIIDIFSWCIPISNNKNELDKEAREMINKALFYNSTNKPSEAERLIKKALLIWDKEEESSKTGNTSTPITTETVSIYDLEALDMLFDQDLKTEEGVLKPTNCPNNNLQKKQN